MRDDAAEGDLDVPGDGPEDAPRVIGILPQLSEDLAGLRQRVEVVQQDVAAVVARLHTLAGAVANAETSLGDRLSEYSETVVQLGRGLTSNVTTYREGNERSVADLRRALADSEELLRSVLTKADDLVVEVAALRGDLTSAAAAERAALDADEVRGIVQEAVEPLDVRPDVGRLASDLAAVGERLSAEVAATAARQPSPSAVDGAVHAELLGAVESVRSEVEQLRRAESKPTRAPADIERERALVRELESIRKELTALGTSVVSPPAPAPAPSPAVEAESVVAMHAELMEELAMVRAGLEQPRPAPAAKPSRTKADVERERALVTELESIRDEIGQLKRRIAVRAKATGIDDEQLASLIETLTAALQVRLSDGELDRVAEAVTKRFADAFEVVPDEEPAATEAPPAASSRTSKSASRRS